MATLGWNRYGKAEVRLVHVDRSTPEHLLTDLNVSVALSGDLAATHLTGDNTGVLPTDTQKNTVYAFAAKYGVADVGAFALRLARHFVGSQPAINGAEVTIERYGWSRLGPHSFARDGDETAHVAATVDADGERLGAGISGLVLVNTTGSAFAGFARDEYTTLAETDDRILATAVDARWRYAEVDGDGAGVRDLLLKSFVDTPSDSLQQTLYAMGAAVVEHCPDVAEITLRLPNRHHFLVDLAPFGLVNDNAVYHAADRPYGLIEATVRR